MPAADHPEIKPPDNPETKIWRYMDFTKFVSMLETRSLFFARADCLGDPFEGSYSRGNEKLRELYTGKVPAPELRNFFGFMELMRTWTMVSCWHMNNHESAAMWKLYAKSDEAIAIASTYQQLKEELDNDCFVGKVEYLDYDSDVVSEHSTFAPYFCKRLSFSHEHELRAVIQKPKIGRTSSTPPSGGVSKPIALERLVNEVRVAPTCQTWYVDLVKRVVARHELPVDVHRSSLDSDPFF